MSRIMKLRIISCLTLLSLVIIGLVIFMSITTSHRKLSVSSDIVSTFEIDNKVYSLNPGKPLHITLSKKSYNYRSIGSINGLRIVNTNVLDATDKGAKQLTFSYKIYTNQSISEALCSITDFIKDSEGNCASGADTLSVRYVENYQWAVSKITVPGYEDSMAILRIINGRWKVVAGPATDLITDGYYPESVERAIKDVR